MCQPTSPWSGQRVMERSVIQCSSRNVRINQRTSALMLLRQNARLVEGLEVMVQIHTLVKVKVLQIHTLVEVKMLQIHTLVKVKVLQMHTLVEVKVLQIHTLVKVKVLQIHTLVEVKVLQIHTLVKVKVLQIHTSVEVKGDAHKCFQKSVLHFLGRNVNKLRNRIFLFICKQSKWGRT